jgi:peptidyl-tRNA hydrolase, PTH1 family
MILIAGLGNPGDRYVSNRHNIGFMAADAIAARHRFSPWRSKFNADCAEGTLDGVKTVLIKPMTYMNNSGEAVGKAARFYKIAPESVIVIHDEMDLAPGKVRVKTGGGAGGHNGLRSIQSHIGPDFRRVRLGVGHPGDKDRVTGHVLNDFAKADRDWLGPLLDAVADQAGVLVRGEESSFMNKVHLAISPPKEPRARAGRGEERGGDA